MAMPVRDLLWDFCLAAAVMTVACGGVGAVAWWLFHPREL